MDKKYSQNCKPILIQLTTILILGFTITKKLHKKHIYKLVVEPLKSFVRKFRPKLFHQIDSRKSSGTFLEAARAAAAASAASTAGPTWSWVRVWRPKSGAEFCKKSGSRRRPA
jgi:hypothetical protein